MLHSPNIRATSGDAAGRRSYTTTEIPAEQRRSIDFPFILRLYGRGPDGIMLRGEPLFVPSEEAGQVAGQCWLESGARVFT